MTGDSYTTEVDVTVNYDEDDNVVICIDLGGELHVFDIESATAFYRMIQRAVEWAEDNEYYGPPCEFDA